MNHVCFIKLFYEIMFDGIIYIEYGITLANRNNDETNLNQDYYSSILY